MAFEFITNGDEYINYDSPNYMTNYPNVDSSTAGHWFAFNEFKVRYNGGQLLGHGGWYVKLDPSVKPVFLGEWSDGSAKVEFREKRIDDGGDPITQWEGVITNLSDNSTKIENYESSKEMRSIIGNLITGTNYEDRDRCPAVNLWVGRSWIEDEQETLYFYAENSAMVDAVAEYYDLPQPYDTSLKQRLDDNPESMRFKSYDIYGKGEGNFAALVVAGIVFENKNPTMLKIFELKRWND